MNWFWGQSGMSRPFPTAGNGYPMSWSLGQVDALSAQGRAISAGDRSPFGRYSPMGYPQPVYNLSGFRPPVTSFPSFNVGFTPFATQFFTPIDFSPIDPLLGQPFNSGFNQSAGLFNPNTNVFGSLISAFSQLLASKNQPASMPSDPPAQPQTKPKPQPSQPTYTFVTSDSDDEEQISCPKRSTQKQSLAQSRTGSGGDHSSTAAGQNETTNNSATGNGAGKPDTKEASKSNSTQKPAPQDNKPKPKEKAQTQPAPVKNDETHATGKVTTKGIFITTATAKSGLANPSSESKANVVFDGDSLMTGVEANTSLGKTYTVHKQAHSGDHLATQIKAGVSNVLAKYDPNSQDNVVVLWGGTNDLVGGASSSTMFANLKAIAQQYKDKGFKVVILTNIQSGPPISDEEGAGLADIAIDKKRQAFNKAIREAKDPPWDMVIDVAAMPEFSDKDNAVTNNKNYYEKGNNPIHLTGKGYQLIANKVDEGVRQLLEAN